MSRDVKILILRNRIKLLESRGSHNSKIVNKLQRQIRKLEG